MLNIELSYTQIIFVQNPSKIGIDEVFSSILRDLIIKGVLQLHRIKTLPTKRSKKVQKYFRFMKGQAYSGYEPLPFETSFLSPLEDIDQVQPKVLTNYVLRNYSMPSAFISKKIYAPLAKDKYISSIPVLKAFGFYSIKTNTKNMLTEVNDFINTQEETLLSLINGDNSKFISTMNETGSYVFMLEKKNPDLYKDIISMVNNIYKNQPLGADNDLSNFMEAFSVNMSYFEEH